MKASELVDGLKRASTVCGAAIAIASKSATTFIGKRVAGRMSVVLPAVPEEESLNFSLTCAETRVVVTKTSGIVGGSHRIDVEYTSPGNVAQLRSRGGAVPTSHPRGPVDPLPAVPAAAT